MAERKLAGVAVDQIQADGEDDVDADVDSDDEIVGIELRRETAKRRKRSSERASSNNRFGVADASDFFHLHFAEQPGGSEEQNQNQDGKRDGVAVGRGDRSRPRKFR